MTIALKQSTASQEIPLGYFVDSGDGNTEEGSLTIANTDIKLWKNGATTLANKNSGGATHISNGIYYATLDATDTNTLGPMVIFVHVSGALPVRLECCVYAANVYDSMIAGTDYLQTDVIQVEGSDATDQIRDAVVDDATRIDASAINTLSSHDPGGTIAAQSDITGLNDPTAAAIADAVWDEAIAGHVGAGSFGEEVQSHALSTEISALNDPTAADIADAVWDEAIAGHLSAGSTGLALNSAGSAGDPWSTALPGAYGAGTAGYIVGNNLDASVADVEADTQDIQSRLPAALVGGRIDANAGSISGDATAADNLEAMLDGTGGVDLDLAHLNIIATTGSALTIQNSDALNPTVDIQNTTANGDAVKIAVANTGSGDALLLVGGASGAGSGINVASGAVGVRVTGGTGIDVYGTSGRGMSLSAEGVGAALYLYGGKFDGTEGVIHFDDSYGVPAILMNGGNATYQTLVVKNNNVSGDVFGPDLAAAIQQEATDALNAYDPPTDAEMAAAFAALNDPTAAAIADAVWDEAKAGHVAAGSFGEEVQSHALSTEISALNDPTETEIADAILKRDWTSVTGEADRSALNALRSLRNKVGVSGGTLTVYQEDDSTEAWTGAVTTDSGADPITEVDPA